MKLFDQIPHQVCVCSYHENVRLLLVALKEHTSLNTDFSAFIEQVTCDASSKNCMSGKCSECDNASKNMLQSTSPTQFNTSNGKVSTIG